MRLVLIHPSPTILSAWTYAAVDAGHVVELAHCNPAKAILLETKYEPDFLVMPEGEDGDTAELYGKTLPAPARAFCTLETTPRHF